MCTHVDDERVRRKGMLSDRIMGRTHFVPAGDAVRARRTKHEREQAVLRWRWYHGLLLSRNPKLVDEDEQ